MEFSIKSGNPEKQRSACVVVGIFESGKLSRSAESLDKAGKGFISTLIKQGDLTGKAGSTLLLHSIPGTSCERVLVVGLGKDKEFREKEFIAALRKAIKTLGDTAAADASIFLTELPLKKRSTAWKIRQTALIAIECSYRFEQFKSKKAETPKPLSKITLMIESAKDGAEAKEALKQGIAMGRGMSLTRDLGNLPANICHPTYLAEQAMKMAKTYKLECQILEQADMEKLGMHSLLSVSRGSAQPPKLICLSHKGGKDDEKPVVLVGKGVTFDTGGISLKPGADMDEMKFDMCGAASVLGTMDAVARMGLPINLTIIVPAVENMPGSQATRPGDIVTSMSGQTIEILNTDAEGRLILCDALTYAERFDPQIVIDVATLTGACVVALGNVATGLFSNKDSLADDLLDAGSESNDRAWHMPLWDDYQELLKSAFADMGNIGGRWGGAITAACFLSRFTKKYEWAHLDIAGTAWTGKEASGRPVPLLTHYLLQRAGKLN